MSGVITSIRNHILFMFDVSSQSGSILFFQRNFSPKILAVKYLNLPPIGVLLVNLIVIRTPITAFRIRTKLIINTTEAI